jgi:hypothetical protein
VKKPTVFLGSGFAAKYPEGGGNFAVPLQWALGLQRLGIEAVWLELMPSSGDPARDAECLRIFQERLQAHRLPCLLLLQHEKSDHQDLDGMTFHGMERRDFLERLPGSTLLNLSYSIRPPLLELFERRVFINIDPTEISFWMSRLELGQSFHTEFWTIGLNIHSPECKLPPPPPNVRWQTFYPLVDTTLLQPAPRPVRPRVTTVGQWYWEGWIEIDGTYRDCSKKAQFEPYLGLPAAVPGIEWELAMHMNPGDTEADRLRHLGWHHVFPREVVSSPDDYFAYLRGSLAEFTPVKVDDQTLTGWISDRAAAYLALGRPVLTESTAAEAYLPPESGFLWVRDLETATEAAHRLLRDWPALSQAARACAVEYFDSVKTLRRILNG